MLKRTIIPLLLLLAAPFVEAKAVTFATERLEKLAGYVGLNNLDNLGPGVCNTYTFRQHQLTVRVNRWNEVEHIGLLLFSNQLRSINPLPVYDFLERYLLARMVTPQSSETGVKMGWDNVYFAKGNATTALQIDTLTEFSENHIDLRAYKVAWAKDGKKLLEMSFDMDWQLLSGCNALELERRLFTRLRREPVPMFPESTPDFPSDGTEYTLGGNFLINPSVRNDLYYSRENKKKPWRLTDNRQRPLHTLSNILMAPEAGKGLKISIAADKYGLRPDSATVDYRTWLKVCMDDGCSPYFGLKNKEAGVYHCSVFMLNRLCGYFHLLSVDVDEQILTDQTTGTAKARLYCYIPLHNLSANVLGDSDFEPIK